MRIDSYRDLKVWQLSMQLAGEVYRISSALPQSELYGLNSQLRRAAVSVAANIAEGHTRDSTKEFLRFISISLGSVAEIETLLLLCEQLGYFEKASTQSLLTRIDEVGKMLRGLQKSLRAKL